MKPRAHMLLEKEYLKLQKEPLWVRIRILNYQFHIQFTESESFNVIFLIESIVVIVTYAIIKLLTKISQTYINIPCIFNVFY